MPTSLSDPAPALPTHCDVLVIGAGPAGSACAQALARAGLHVVMADQHRFPRDKICGDGLIPDSHAALQRMGVLDEVMAQARVMNQVRCVGPRGKHLDVPGHLAVLPRKQLDDILCRAAQRAGAQLLTPARFEAPLLDGERVAGAQLRCEAADGTTQLHELRARWVVLATGAVPQALVAAGLCERHTPSGVALRGYYRHDGLRDQITQLQLIWHPKMRGGYGWIFPAPGGLFNIGTGLIDSHQTDADGKVSKQRGAQGGNLRRMLQAFGEVYAPAGELLARGTLVGEVKGAPLRCGLRGARWSRPGMLATGEAAGSTYSFSGEGIGKALETGLLAAEALLHDRAAAFQAEPADQAVRHRYEAALRQLQPRFDIYTTANHVNRHPWLADLVVWRANRSPRILNKVVGVLNETHTPRLFTVGGFARLLFQ
jgi:menaquinone-9 beta-reductase